MAVDEGTERFPNAQLSERVDSSESRDWVAVRSQTARPTVRHSPPSTQSSIQHSRNLSARPFPGLAARRWPLRTARYIVVFPQEA